jgi:CubicO group peptidase (beta-lactamase class C family)
MRVFRPTVILVLMLSPAITAISNPRGQQSATLDAYVESSMKQWKVPGAAVAIIQGHSVTYVKGYGVRDIASGKPVTPDTLFAIGSCTKAFTTAAMAILVDEGKMTWDDPVRKHIDFFHLSDPLADANVTLRDLVTHRTGLDRMNLLWYRSPWTREELIRRAGKAKLSAGFREQWLYSNVMFTAAGYAVGRASGGTMEDFVQKRIFDPLGMKDADFSVVDVQKTANHASPHITMPDGTVKSIPWLNADATGGAGTINASARAMANWIQFQLNMGQVAGVQLISRRNMQEMRKPQIVVPYETLGSLYFPDTTQLSYGLGWFVQEYRGHQVITHGGGIDGFTSLVGFVPERAVGFVVLTNHSEDAHLPQVVGYRILDSLLGLRETDWNTYYKAEDEKSSAEESRVEREWKANRHQHTSPSREPKAYAGTYENPAFGKIRVYLENGLWFRFNSFASKLEHYHFDTFTVQMDNVGDAEPSVSFVLDLNGNVSKLSLATGSDMQATSTIEFLRVADEE